MRGAISIGRIRHGGAILLALGGCVVLSGCNDPTANFRKPELPTCERFLRSRLRVPTSFHRNWYNVADLPVTRDVLGQATGDAAQAASAPNPAIRRVTVQYQGNDGFGADVTGSGICLFPMTDTGKYAQDIDAAVTQSVHDQEQRTLAVSMGQQGVTAADCCVKAGFDAGTLAQIKPQRRGAVVPFGRKL